ncbi:MAG: hypothetical protein AB7O97_08490 [Planctomycetota bacterium]
MHPTPLAALLTAALCAQFAAAQQGAPVLWRTTDLGTAALQYAPVTPPPLPQARASGPRPAILLTGYWPPSNEAVRQFSPDPVQNPGGWAGANWENRGYDVYAVFPEFSPPTCTTCGPGTGDLEVDYQDTTADFWSIADSIQPIAIITTSRSSTAINWELEMNQYNRVSWANDYVDPRQPTPSPPDATIAPGALRPSKLPVQNIVNALLTAGAPVNPNICFSGNGGGFLSEFIAYLGVWYQDIHRSPTDPAWCVTAGHVHIGRSLSWPVAINAMEITLREVIAYTDAVRAGTVCQTDLGFQGPGAGTLLACGDPLTALGNSADLRFSGGLPTGLAFVGFGLQQNPTPLFGGLAVTVPLATGFLVVLDDQGEWLLEGVPGGLVGASSIFAQAAWFDPALPQSWGLSNALELRFQ